MLFNSYEFLLLFLPGVLVLYFGLGSYSRQAATWALGVASILFYAWWDWRFAPLLCVSIVINFLIGRSLAERPSRPLLVAGIAANLALLGAFKYAGFFAAAANDLAGAALPVPQWVLPLGISFFTFTQIAFLVDTHAGLAREYRFGHYFLFVTYFPHLIAGPLYHHRQIMPQFERPTVCRLDWDNIAAGLTIFIIGLGKKVLIADSLAPYSDGAFGAVHSGAALGFFEVWIGVLAYFFQLYFDFSGYSDMAIGLARMFNVRLPINFDSPYKARSIAELWQRWHMSLGAFLRLYVWLPLGGRARSAPRRYAAIFLTMLLCGFWHGASWMLLLWGALQGVALIVNHAWGRVTRGTRIRSAPFYAFFAWGLTMFFWTMSAPLFRAHTLSEAGTMWAGMLGANGASLPARFEDWAALRAVLEPIFGVLEFHGAAPNFRFAMHGLAVLAAAAAIAFFAPNTQQLVAERAWRPGLAWATTMAMLLSVVFLSLGRPSPFLYYQF